MTKKFMYLSFDFETISVWYPRYYQVDNFIIVRLVVKTVKAPVKAPAAKPAAAKADPKAKAGAKAAAKAPAKPSPEPKAKESAVKRSKGGDQDPAPPKRSKK